MITPDTSAFARQLQSQLDTAVKGAGTKPGATVGKELSQEAGKAGKSAGQSFSKGLSDAIVAIGAIAAARRVGQFFASTVDAATEFESSFTGIRKTVDATDSEFRQLAEANLDLAGRIGTSVNELNRIGELAGSLGVTGVANIEKFTGVIADLANTTNLTADEGATAFAQIASVIGLPIEQIDRFGSAIVDVGNKFQTTESDITEFSKRIAGAGKIAGLTAADVAGIAGAFASVGVEAEAGGTAIQKVLIGITRAVAEGGDSLEAFAATTGLTAEQFRALARDNPAEAFTLFVEGLGRAGDKAFGILEGLELTDQRLTRAFLSTAGAGDLLRRSIGTANTAFEENTALTAEATKRYETNETRLRALGERFNRTKIQIGGVVAGGVIPLIEAFAKVPAPVLAAGAAISGLAAVGVAVAVVATKVKGLTDALTAMGPAGARAAKGLGVLGRAGFIAGILGAITAGLEALDVAIEKIGGPGESAGKLEQRIVALGTASVGSAKQVDELIDAAGAAKPGFFDLGRLLDDIIPSLDDVDSRTAKSVERFEDLDQALSRVAAGGAPEAAAKAFERISSTLRAQGVEVEVIDKLFNDYRATVDGLAADQSIQAASTKSATGALEDMEKPTESLTAGFDKLSEAVDAYSEALESTLGLTRDVRDSQVSVEAAIDDLSESIKENGRTFDARTEKGRSNISAVGDLIDAEVAYVEALRLSGRISNDDATQKQTLIGRLRDLERRFPSARREIDQYVAALRRTPTAVTTKVQVDTNPARTALDAFVKGLPPRLRKIEVEAFVQGTVKAELGGPKGTSDSPFHVRVVNKDFGRAAGGGVSVSHAYLVGERGPELFVPGASGYVMPAEVTRRILAQVAAVHADKIIPRQAGGVVAAVGGGGDLMRELIERVGSVESAISRLASSSFEIGDGFARFVDRRVGTRINLLQRGG